MHSLAFCPWSSIRRQMAPSKGQIFICDNFRNIDIYVSMANDSKSIALCPWSSTERPMAAFWTLWAI